MEVIIKFTRITFSNMVENDEFPRLFKYLSGSPQRSCDSGLKPHLTLGCWRSSLLWFSSLSVPTRTRVAVRNGERLGGTNQIRKLSWQVVLFVLIVVILIDDDRWWVLNKKFTVKGLIKETLDKIITIYVPIKKQHSAVHRKKKPHYSQFDEVQRTHKI